MASANKPADDLQQKFAHAVFIVLQEMLLHWTVPNFGDHYDVDLAKFYHCPCCVHWPFTCANKLLLYPM